MFSTTRIFESGFFFDAHGTAYLDLLIGLFLKVNRIFRNQLYLINKSIFFFADTFHGFFIFFFLLETHYSVWRWDSIFEFH